MPTITVTGTSGNNVFARATGDDPRRYVGLAGNDTYHLRLFDDVITVPPGGPQLVYLRDEAVEAANGGTDTVYLYNSYNPVGTTGVIPLGNANATQLANIEIIYGTNTTRVVGGTTLKIGWNITAGGNNNTITTYDANDTVNGGGGNDTISTGSGADRLIGGDGNDILNGGAGYDRMEGGAGNDTYYYDRAPVFGGDGSDVIVEAAGGGTDTVLSANLSLSLAGRAHPNVENLGLLGSLDLDLTGDEFSNVLTGNAGDNDIVGGDGNDFLKGGAGIDRLDGFTGVDRADYSDKTASVVVTLSGSTPAIVTVGGIAEDTILNIERVTGGSGNDTLTGDELANVFNGGAGNDTLNGRAGADQLAGEAGNDALTGGGGNDILIGGAGRDQMAGGADADVFRFDSVSDVGAGALRDIVADFLPGVDDLSFTLMDANSVVAGNQNFAWRGTGAFTGAGQLRYVQSGGNTIVQANLDGNLATVEFEVQLNGLKTLTAADIIL